MGPHNQLIDMVTESQRVVSDSEVNDRIYLAHEMMHAYLRLNSSSSHTPAATASKTGACSDFEKKLVDFCKNQIETDDSPVYGQWRSQKKILGGLWCHWCTLGAHVLGEVLLKSGRLKPRLRGSLAKAVSLKRSVKIAAVEDTVLRLTGCLWCHWCTLGAHVLGEVLLKSGRLKPRLRGSLAKAVSLKRSVKIAAVEDTVLRLTGW
ncbi:hypothetical protein F2Q70_00031203 [Brassica cretica]|uniref:Protein DA1-like domain-containing protein n=1 Tax=Brassica cretica TaxID=69181 RepID=A0A8S9FHY0_BRACR|nr:hypothetical protein F2Q70_00031203 [Brassica cretica]